LTVAFPARLAVRGALGAPGTPLRRLAVACLAAVDARPLGLDLGLLRSGAPSGAPSGADVLLLPPSI
jgi:hypothetical protein